MLDHAEANNNLGKPLQDQGEPDEAVACYRRAVHLRPDYLDASKITQGIPCARQGQFLASHPGNWRTPGIPCRGRLDYD